VLRQRAQPAAGLDCHLEAERLLESVAERDERWWATWIDVKVEQAHHHYFQGDAQALAELVELVGPEVERRGNPAQQLDLLHVRAQHAYRRERYVLSAETEELMRDIHRRGVELGDPTIDFTLGFALLWRGKLAEATSSLAEGLASARTRGHALIEVRCLVYGALAERRLGNVDRVRALLAELAALEDLQGYDGLVHALQAWVAYRDGDLDVAEEAGRTALTEWDAERRAGPTMFQWTARVPLAAVELERGRVEAAVAQFRELLDPLQQPPPPELLPLVEEAVETGERGSVERALEAARPLGYA
jgi:hypothetical protein